jgi:hypothetical protein
MIAAALATYGYAVDIPNQRSVNGEATMVMP